MPAAICFILDQSKIFSSGHILTVIGKLNDKPLDKILHYVFPLCFQRVSFIGLFSVGIVW